MSSSDSWVVDASILVDLVIGGSSAGAGREVLAGCQLHVPAHVDVEVTSALARLHRANLLTKAAAGRALSAFYVELAHQLGTQVLTVDARLARASPYAVLPPGFGV